jgi:hypothetical protein
VSSLDDDFSDGLTAAMGNYISNSSVKMRLDILQIDWACCGDDSFKDWFTTNWIPNDILVLDPESKKSVHL